MNKKRILIILFFLTWIIGFGNQVQSASNWYNTSWDYRRAIIIGNTGNSNELADYQVEVSVTYDSDMQADFDDVRFTDSDGTTLLDHWRETYIASTSATFWVEVPIIPASSTKIIYMYYGNDGVDDASSGNNTFRFFDDFSSSLFTTALKWEYSPEADVSTWFHYGIIKDGKYYSVEGPDDGSSAKLREIDISTGALLHSYALGGGAWATPWIVGDYIYVYAAGANKLYKISLSSWTINASADVSGNGYVETFAADDTYIYLPETTKISKRRLDTLAEVASFNCTGVPRGVLRRGGVLYFNTAAGKFYAVNTTNMSEAGKIDLDIADASGSYDVPIYDADNDRIYVVDTNAARTDGNVYSINPNTYTIAWKVDATAGYGIPSTPAYRNNRLFIAYWKPASEVMGYYKALDVTNNGSEIWSKQFSHDNAWGGMTLDDNYIYTSTKDVVSAPPSYFLIINQSNGELIHSELTDYERPCSVVSLSNGLAIVGSQKRIYGFEVGTGSSVDSLFYHGNENYTGYIANAVTSNNDFSLTNANWTNSGDFNIQNGTLKKYAAYVNSKAAWTGVAMSSTGQYQTAVISGGRIYISTDYGATWVLSENSSTATWRGIAMSSTGQYQTAVDYTGYIYTSNDYGDNWTSRDSSRNWNGVAMSSTGQYQTAVVYDGQIYISTNYGVTWVLSENSSTASWRGIAMSSTGQYQTAGAYGEDGDIYVSDDYGNTWTGKEIYNYWTGVAISKSSDPLIDGKYQTAVGDGDGGGTYIYVSSNFGGNWSQKGNTPAWTGVAMSGTGQYQTAVATDTGDGGEYIYISSNSGNNWSSKGNYLNWRGIAMSSNGQYQTAVADNENIYISTDSGSTWALAGGKNYIIASTSTLSYPLAIEAKAKVGSDWSNEYGWNFALSWDSNWQNTGYFSGHYKDASLDYSSLKRFSGGSQSNSNETNESIVADTWYRLAFLVGSSTQYYNVDSTQKTTLTTSPPTEDPTNIILSTSRLAQSSGYTTYFDWVFVRNYTSPEPSITVGSEITSHAITITGQIILNGGTTRVADVFLTLSGETNDTTNPNTDGNYSFVGLEGGNYTVTPSLENYYFFPVSYSYTSLDSNQTEQNFVGWYEASGGGKGGNHCFIATVAYEISVADEVKVLSIFRDEYLLTNPIGEGFVNTYYKVSPSIASFIREHPVLKNIVRTTLTPLIWMSRKTIE